MAAHNIQFQEETRNNQKNTTTSIKNLEFQTGQIAQQLASTSQLFTELESEVRKSSNGGKCGEFCILLCVSAGTAVLSALTG
ncbi:hypothetical protein KIW84_012464 [Lathyrus oleraceus]|uniref:Uncharacterized protein n=1 Tax=Pisum sativum TaxID=3888 RepID=A0A9D5GWS6_PEA|nr:hypothetical protein KIW84_012464 [Pisum sativum]